MKKHILAYCEERKRKKKSGNCYVTYEELLRQAAGEDERRQIEIQTESIREFQRLLEELVQENVLKPVDNSRKKEFIGKIYGKYSIIGNPPKKETDKEFITQLHSYIGTKVFEYYRYKKETFLKDREAIDIIYNYYRRSEKERLTSNELGYYLFGDEKSFEQPEKGNEQKEKIGKYAKLLKNMGLEMEKDLHAYYTIEPFFCQMRESFFEKNQRQILIVENKDTYFRLKAHEITGKYDCVIYGEGWKITKSFSLAGDTGIIGTDRIDYFGDIDPEGFVIYKNLKERYPEYRIQLQSEFYRQTIAAAVPRNLQNIKGIVEEKTMQEAFQVLEEFDSGTAEYLKTIMEEGHYIPQEAIVLSLLPLT